MLAAFDPQWGAKNLEHILVMVRDIANPSKDDHYFPVHRYKDWYMGHSWASGIAVPGGKPNFSKPEPNPNLNPNPNPKP